MSLPGHARLLFLLATSSIQTSIVSLFRSSILSPLSPGVSRILRNSLCQVARDGCPHSAKRPSFSRPMRLFCLAVARLVIFCASFITFPYRWVPHRFSRLMPFFHHSTPRAAFQTRTWSHRHSGPFESLISPRPPFLQFKRMGTYCRRFDRHHVLMGLRSELDDAVSIVANVTFDLPLVRLLSLCDIYIYCLR
jgi:hypothetical protein